MSSVLEMPNPYFPFLIEFKLVYGRAGNEFFYIIKTLLLKGNVSSLSFLSSLFPMTDIQIGSTF